ncbi:hypothetical protein KIH31_15725 [Paenarthrobacter sp. DKR-5]|uniref:hypothetical protein n=1 Tax=Paenarthrobacter sp. DKR-5 TaxID=2835535 RepID=UPI001BDC9465|nr:hypothetical protein [Paenarthrobacter sp. DKR-5]MBT1004036.1 hypothetical protein [Paenarthrobacter sp. DKR-5]
MLNEHLHPVWAAAARLEALHWETDRVSAHLHSSMRQALQAGETLEDVAGAANLTEVQVIARAGLSITDLPSVAFAPTDTGTATEEDPGAPAALEPA